MRKFLILFLGFLINSTIAFIIQTYYNPPSYGACVTPNYESGKCIVLQNCKQLFRLLITPPLNPNAEIYLRRSQCGVLGNNVLICCPDRFREINPYINLYSQIPIPAPVIQSRQVILPKPGTCGHILVTKIFGGKRTKIDEFPWMALIEYTKPGNEKGHHCGGSLINTRYVITASHCVNGRSVPANWKVTGVRLGEWDTTTNPDCEVDLTGKKDCAPPHVDVPVEKLIPHPGYNPNDRRQINDIALLRLSYNIEYTYFISPICLPLNSNLRSTTFDDVIMDVSGWGRTENSFISTVKMKAEIKVVNLSECQTKYDLLNINLVNTQMCAGGEVGIDSCRGDSGGPLIGIHTPNDTVDHYFIAGIVSFGPSPCGMGDWPGVYTRIGEFMDWILNTMKP